MLHVTNLIDNLLLTFHPARPTLLLAYAGVIH